MIGIEKRIKQMDFIPSNALEIKLIAIRRNADRAIGKKAYIQIKMPNGDWRYIVLSYANFRYYSVN